MKLTALLVLLASFITNVSAEEPVPGWLNARWGMTEDEVLAAFPGRAKRLSGKARDVSDDGIGAVAIEKFQLVGEEFYVAFVLDKTEKRLTKVALALEETNSPVAARFAFQELETALTEKYGQPTTATSQQTIIRRSWVFPTNRIELIKGEGVGLAAFVTLKYEKPSAGEKKKL